MYWFQIIAQAESLGHFFLLVASTKVPLDAFCSNSVDIYFCRREGKMAEHAALRRLFPQILQNQPLTGLHLHPGGTCSCVGTPTAIPLKGVLRITTAVAPAHQDGWITVSQAFPLSQQWVHSAACNRALKVIEKVCCTTSALAPVPTRTLVRALGLFYKG